MQEFDLDTRLVRLPGSSHSFPRILSVADDPPGIRLCLDIPADLSWFRGHFPNQPVLPGIVQLHWAIIISCALFEFAGPPDQIKRLKFKKVVIPPRVLELLVTRHGQQEVQFEFCSLGEQNSQGKLVFAGSSA
jgi:3-hydroxymyristoyl/3-hydroxydecanoyl-(acyl carrier protein) dehydratase